MTAMTLVCAHTELKTSPKLNDASPLSNTKRSAMDTVGVTRYTLLHVARWVTFHTLCLWHLSSSIYLQYILMIDIKEMIHFIIILDV